MYSLMPNDLILFFYLPKHVNYTLKENLNSTNVSC